MPSRKNCKFSAHFFSHSVAGQIQVGEPSLVLGTHNAVIYGKGVPQEFPLMACHAKQ